MTVVPLFVQLTVRREPVGDSTKYTAVDVRIVSAECRVFIVAEVPNVFKHLFHLLPSLIVPLLSQTDQKLRLCDICGAFLSVYDRLNFLTQTFFSIFPHLN